MSKDFLSGRPFDGILGLGFPQNSISGMSFVNHWVGGGLSKNETETLAVFSSNKT